MSREIGALTRQQPIQRMTLRSVDFELATQGKLTP